MNTTAAATDTHAVHNSSKHFFMVQEVSVKCSGYRPASLTMTPHRSFPLHGSANFYPTLPSRLTESSFCASTANSIGSLLSTSLA